MDTIARRPGIECDLTFHTIDIGSMIIGSLGQIKFGVFVIDRNHGVGVARAFGCIAPRSPRFVVLVDPCCFFGRRLAREGQDKTIFRAVKFLPALRIRLGSSEKHNNAKNYT